MGLKNDIIKYYDTCQSDYEKFWMNKDNLAMHYGFWTPRIKSHSNSLINMNRVLASVARIKKNEKVLDAGCGVGGSAIWLAKNVCANVVGITLSRKQVKLAKQFAKERGASGLTRFYVMDFTKTKFKSNTFDVVWSIESVCHAQDKGDFVSEAYRILRKGGRLVMADGFMHKRAFTDDEQYIFDKWRKGWAVPNLSYHDKFHADIRSAGFRKITFMDATKNIMPSSRKIYKLSKSLYVPSIIMERMRLRTKIHTGHIVSGINQYKLLKNRLCIYGIFCAEK